MGRDLGDELPLAVALRGVWCYCRDLPNELGRIRAWPSDVGTVGGHMALKDTLAALGPQPRWCLDASARRARCWKPWSKRADRGRVSSFADNSAAARSTLNGLQASECSTTTTSW